jgi:hypothetical protein
VSHSETDKEEETERQRKRDRIKERQRGRCSEKTPENLLCASENFGPSQ